VSDIDSGIAAVEREQITRPVAMEMEGPPLHQPINHRSPASTHETLPSPSNNFQMDPMVIHSIRLLQYIKRTQKANKAELQADIKSDPDAPLANIGPIPPYEGPPLREPSDKKFTTEEDYDRPFVRGEGKSPPSIDDITCRKLLRRSTAAICAHLSFESATESVLETLTDVCHEFLCQLTSHLATARDRTSTNGHSGFPDVIERVFHDMGLGGVTGLGRFYQSRVLGYHQRLVHQCEQLAAQDAPRGLCAGAPGTTDAVNDDGDTLHVISIKEENGGDMQFPLLDENDEVTDAEQLLNIENLGTLEITVEHHATASSATSRLKSSASIDESGESEAGGASVAGPPADPVAAPHCDPQTLLDPPGARSSLTLADPGSASSVDMFSPPILTGEPSKPKKKKKA